MHPVVHRLLSLWSAHLPVCVAVAAVLSLAFAYTMQYGFGFQPCILCLYQRPPYFVAIVLAVISLVSSRPPDPRFAWSEDKLQPGSPVAQGAPAFAGATRLVCLLLSAVAFAVGGAIGAFQVGVEEHWWAGLSSCGGGSLGGLTATEILAQIESAATVRCDDVQFRFLGLSMAAMNTLWSFALAAAVGVGLIYPRQAPHA